MSELSSVVKSYSRVARGAANGGVQKMQSSEQNVDPVNPSRKLSGIWLGPKAATELLFVAAREADKMESVTVRVCTSLLGLLACNVL